MTDHEVNLIGRQLAALEATFKAELEHITKRLDSHSVEIKQVSGSVEQIKRQLAVNAAAEKVKCHYADQAEDVQQEKSRFKRSICAKAIFWIVTWLISSLGGGWIATHIH